MWVKFIKQTYSEKIQGHDPFNNQPNTSNFNFTNIEELLTYSNLSPSHTSLVVSSPRDPFLVSSRLFKHPKLKVHKYITLRTPFRLAMGYFI